MQGFIIDIEEATLENSDFRRVLYTTRNSQLSVACLKPRERTGTETHKLDQFIHIASGEGKAVLNGAERKIKKGSSITIPSGTKHNIVNTSHDKPLKFYSVHSPPHHRDGIVHKTKSDAENTKARFDGETTEK